MKTDSFSYARGAAAGLAIALTTAHAQAAGIAHMPRRALISTAASAPVAARAALATATHAGCSVAHATPLSFASIAADARTTESATATIALEQGCLASGLSIVLGDGGATHGFTMQAGHASLPFDMYLGGDASGERVWNGVPLAPGSLDPRSPQIRIFGVVTAPGALAPGAYSDVVTVTLQFN